MGVLPTWCSGGGDRLCYCRPRVLGINSDSGSHGSEIGTETVKVQ